MDFILFSALSILIISCIIRSLNIGYQKESYLLSIISFCILLLHPLILESYYNYTFNFLFLVSSVIGYFRWRYIYILNYYEKQKAKEIKKLEKDPILKLD